MTTARQTLVASKLAARGAQVMVTHSVEGTYDPTTGAASVATQATTTYALLDNYSGIQWRDGVEVGDKRVYLAGSALSFVPQTGDKVTIDGEVWSVVRVDRINPDGVTYLYDMQVRR